MQIYIAHSFKTSSGKMRGKQICDELNKDTNYNTININIRNISKLNSIRNSIVFIIKQLKSFDLLERLYINKNIIIYDLIDNGIKDNQQLKQYYPKVFRNINNLKYIHYILTVNRTLIKYISKKIIKPLLKKQTFFKKKQLSNIICIYHHWDPNIINTDTTSDKLNICYIGQCKDNTNCLHVKSINNINILGARPIKTDYNNYNCHFNIRNPILTNFNFKSNIKLSTAAAMNSNIITTRDKSITELLNPKYPYFTTHNINDIRNTIKYVEYTYCTDIWFKALEDMQKVKERTSIEVIIKDYKNLIDTIRKKL
jgi:hypothetical protein